MCVLCERQRRLTYGDVYNMLYSARVRGISDVMADAGFHDMCERHRWQFMQHVGTAMRTQGFLRSLSEGHRAHLQRAHDIEEYIVHRRLAFLQRHVGRWAWRPCGGIAKRLKREHESMGMGEGRRLNHGPAGEPLASPTKRPVS